jgi:hypothetical protein
VPISQASHLTYFLAISCGDPRCSDYSSVTRKSRLDKEMWLSALFSRGGPVCARSVRSSVREARPRNRYDRHVGAGSWMGGQASFGFRERATAFGGCGRRAPGLNVVFRPRKTSLIKPAGVTRETRNLNHATMLGNYGGFAQSVVTIVDFFARQALVGSRHAGLVSALNSRKRRKRRNRKPKFENQKPITP